MAGETISEKEVCFQCGHWDRTAGPEGCQDDFHNVVRSYQEQLILILNQTVANWMKDAEKLDSYSWIGTNKDWETTGKIQTLRKCALEITRIIG